MGFFLMRKIIIIFNVMRISESLPHYSSYDIKHRQKFAASVAEPIIKSIIFDFNDNNLII